MIQDVIGATTELGINLDDDVRNAIAAQRNSSSSFTIDSVVSYKINSLVIFIYDKKEMSFQSQDYFLISIILSKGYFLVQNTVVSNLMPSRMRDQWETLFKFIHSDRSENSRKSRC